MYERPPIESICWSVGCRIERPAFVFLCENVFHKVELEIAHIDRSELLHVIGYVELYV